MGDLSRNSVLPTCPTRPLGHRSSQRLAATIAADESPLSENRADAKNEFFDSRNSLFIQILWTQTPAVGGRGRKTVHPVVLRRQNLPICS